MAATAAATVPLLLCACAPVSAVGNTAQQTRQSLIVKGVAIPVELDAASIDSSGDHESAVVGGRGDLVALTDSYASKPQGMSRCQAGREVYFRVIDRAARQERYAKLTESCLRDVVSGDPPLNWTAPGRVTLNLLSETPVTVELGADGRVTHAP